jgi:hypothetical protein|tara:strand:+ start:42 stop:407 length:366 start_codon:yes stop_codon:yes gene_type:complete
MIINLTQHMASKEQLALGVEDLHEDYRDKVKSLLTFADIPDSELVRSRAERLAAIAFQIVFERGGNEAMIGGAPYLMGPLSACLKVLGIQALFAFSERVSQDGPDGEKVSVFKHRGWVKTY